MLNIKHKLQLGFPHITFDAPHHRMQLSPVVADTEDDLLAELERLQQEDSLTLEETPDPYQLESFWNGVSEDLKNDPQWFDFSVD